MSDAIKFAWGRTIIAMLLLLKGSLAIAQSLPVGNTGVNDYYRRKQLLGELDSLVSFNIRPLNPEAAFGTGVPFDPDSNLYARSIYNTGKRRVKLQLLPVFWQQQYNAANPYGWNDGSMIPARGYQTQMSLGLFGKLGVLSIHLQPEFVYAENRKFDGLDIYKGFPDLVSRFGNRAYAKVSWGQSNVRVTFKGISLGLSNENLWWGPGLRSALILSNNSSGFKHLTLNTTRPVKTPIGSFEGQVISGRLENSGYSYLDAIPLYSDRRYLSGMVLSYQPRWVPGLFLGLNRTFQAYQKDIKGFSGYFPFLAPFQKVFDDENGNSESGSDSRDQYASFHVRWLFTKAQAEVYFEYGVNDHAYNTKVFLGNPEASRAYLAGFRKLIKLNGRPEEFLQFATEVTQMSQPLDRILRSAGPWYYHYQIRQGHTNEGEVLGAGIGPGGNLQSFDLSWVRNYNSIGLQGERYVHDDDYYYSAVGDLNGMSRKWVDFSISPYIEWEYRRLLIAGKIALIKSMNYQWQSRDIQAEQFYIPYNDHLNIHGKLGLTYRF